MHRSSIVVFELPIRIFYLSLRMSHNLIKLFHPLGDNSQDRCRFNKENTILNLRIGISWRVFIDLSSNNKFGISLNLLIVVDILSTHVIVICCFWLFHLPLFVWHKYLFKHRCHQIVKIVILLVAPLNHIVDNPHNFLSVVPTFLLLPVDYLVFTHSCNEIVSDLPFVVNRWDLWSQSYVWILNFCLRILVA